MTDTLQDIADVADELTDSRQHVELLHGWDRNRNRKIVRRITTIPSLLTQLAAAVFPGETHIENEGTRGGFASRPPARLDAIDRLLAIEAGSARWCISVRLSLRDDASSNIRALVGAAGTMDSDTAKSLLDELRLWRNWAATVTGWQTPPWRPRVPCPACDRTDQLRVRLDQKTACCMQCGEAWDADTIGLLAEHIRYVTELAERTKSAS